MFKKLIPISSLVLLISINVLFSYDAGDTVGIYFNHFMLRFTRDTLPQTGLVRYVGDDFYILTTFKRRVPVSDIAFDSTNLFIATVCPAGETPLYLYTKELGGTEWYQNYGLADIDTNGDMSIYKLEFSHDAALDVNLLYTATSCGLARSGINYITFYRIFDIPTYDISFNPATSDSMLGGLVIYAATENGVYRLTTNGPAPYAAVDSVRMGSLEGPIYAIAVNPYDTSEIFCGTEDGLYAWNGTDWDIALSGVRVNKIVWIGLMELCVATDDGLYIFSSSTWDHVLAGHNIKDIVFWGAEVLVADSGNGVLRSADGVVWFEMNEGLDRFAAVGGLEAISIEVVEGTYFVGTAAGIFEWSETEGEWRFISDGIVDLIGDDRVEAALQSVESPFGTGCSLLDLVLDYLNVNPAYLADVDNDPRIFLVIAPLEVSTNLDVVEPYLSPVYGYFDPFNEDTTEPNSNAKEILFVNADEFDDFSSENFKAYVAYLLGEYVSYSLDPGEIRVLRSGFGMYAAQKIGFDVVDGFLEGNQFAITPQHFFERGLFEGPQYFPEYVPVVREFDRERILLFLWYLREQLGDMAVYLLLMNTSTGEAGVEEVLQTMGYSGTLADFVDQWLIASIVNYPNASFYGGIYGYNEIELPEFMPHEVFSVYPIDRIDDFAYKYGAKLYVLSEGSDNITLYFNGEDLDSFRVHVIPFYMGTGVPISVDDISLDELNSGSINLDGMGTLYDSVVVIITRTTDVANGRFWMDDDSAAVSVQPPKSLRAESGHRGYIPIYWAPPPVKDSFGYTYNVYRSVGESGPPYELIAEGISEDFYIDSTPPLDTVCFYVVTSVKTGFESNYSEEVSAIAYTFPPPRNLCATGISNGVYLTWDTPYDATTTNLRKIAKGNTPKGLKGLVGYEVYRGDSLGSFELLAEVTANCFLDTIPFDGETRYYYVLALYENPSGASPPVDTISASPMQGGDSGVKRIIELRMGDVWDYTTNFGCMGGEASSGYLGYSWPGSSDFNNYYLWLSYIWVGADVNGEYYVTAHDYVEPEWYPGEISGGIRGNALQLTSTFNDFASCNFNNCNGRHLGVEATLRALSWDDPVLENAIAWEMDLTFHPDECDIEGVGDCLENVYIGFVFDADVSGIDWTDPHLDDLVDYDGWDGDDSETDLVDEITLNPDGTYEPVPDGVPDEFTVFGDEPDEHTLNGDTLIVSRNACYIYDADNPDTPEDDAGENGYSAGYIGLSLIYAPETPSDSIWVEEGETLRMVLPHATAWWNWEMDPPDDEEMYRYLEGTSHCMGGYRFMPNPLSMGAGPFDYRFLLSVGPFTLHAGQRVTVVLGSGVGQGLNGGYDYVYRNGEWVPGLRHILDYLLKAYYWGSESSDPFHPSSPYEDYHWGAPPLGVEEAIGTRTGSWMTVSPTITNSRIDLKFALPRRADVSVDLYDASGRCVRQLVRDEFSEGEHRLSFDLNKGGNLPTGVYFLKFESPVLRGVKKLILIE